MSDEKNAAPSDKQWQLIEKLLNKSLDEQIKTRRWNWIFRIAFLFVILIGIGALGNERQEASSLQTHTALVDIKGEIADDQPANADDIIEGLRKAFANPHAKAVILRINSPGGSPVQSSLVYEEINRLKKQTGKKIYAAITDSGASGAYYIASACDFIYANPSSIVGSIGVLTEGFGFVDAMKKIGIERRVWSAGENKVELDPYSPVKAEDVARMKTVLDSVHQQFIADVKAGRGQRLKSVPGIFSGLFWTGKQAVSIGIIDGLASSDQIARNMIHENHIVDYTVKPDFFTILSGRLGVMIGQGMVGALGLHNIQWR